MMNRLWPAVLGLMLFSSSPLWAKTMFITDRIEVGVRSGIGIEQKFVASVKTGDRVEVLEGDQNWTKVKLQNGTVGWVATRFLVDQVRTATTLDPKTQEELKGVKDQNLALSKQLESFKQEREKLLKEQEEGKKVLHDLQQEKQGRVAPELNQMKAHNDQLEKQINELKQQAAANQQRGNNQRLNEQIWWFLSGSGVLFVGLILGWLASRRRKKTSRFY
jgi:SH3 domain protein